MAQTIYVNKVEESGRLSTSATNDEQSITDTEREGLYFHNK